MLASPQAPAGDSIMLTHSPGLMLVAQRDRRRTALRAAVVIGSLAVVCALDSATGSAPVQHLYYVPIIIAGLWFMRWGSLIAAGASIVLYHVANPHLLAFRYNELDLVQIALFIAVGLVTSRLVLDARRPAGARHDRRPDGLHNLRSFEANLASIVHTARAPRRRYRWWFDVDRLKPLNDRYGHLAGSGAVREVGRIIAETVPRDAIACRYGGDEFVIALPRRNESQAKEIAGSLSHRVHALAPTLAGIAFPAARFRSASASRRGRCFAVFAERPEAMSRAARRCFAPRTARSTWRRTAAGTASASRDVGAGLRRPHRIEPVPDPWFGEQVPGFDRIGLQFLAQLADEHAEILGLFLGGLSPNRAQQSFVRQDAVRMPGHEDEQVEFLWRQTDRLPVHADAMVVKVDMERSHANRGCFRLF